MEIANRAKIERILERIVYQIAENHCDAKKIVFVGVKESGWILAKEVIHYLNRLIAAEIQLISLEIDKKNPILGKAEIKLSESLAKDSDVIILVDDVINSGRTLFYALHPFLNIKIEKLQTLILVERKYKRFPIIADYVGISLNTTMKEHIEVKVKGNKLESIELV